MDLKELRKQGQKDLQIILRKTRDNLRELRFKDANKQLKNVREIRALRVTVARVLTLLNMPAGRNDTEKPSKAAAKKDQKTGQEKK